MDGISLQLGAGAHAKWWPANAQYAADFINQRYAIAGNPGSAVDAFSFSRSSAKWSSDSAGSWREFSADQLALTDLGVSLEPAASNLVPNSALAGAAVGTVGSGGSLPTGWYHNGALTTAVVAITTLAGLPALHLRVSGLAASTFYELSAMPAATAVSALQTYTASVWAQSVSGSMPIIQMRQAGTGDVQTAGASLVSGSGQRWSATFETHASTIQGRLRFGIVMVAGQSYAVEFLVACPQIEAGSVATSPLLASRSADVLTLALPSGSFGVTALHAGTTTPLSGGSGSYPVSTGLSSSLVRQIVAVQE